MIVMIFEFWFDPEADDTYQSYLRESEKLRELLPDLPGFHGVERFTSDSEPGKFVAIGFFENEEAVTAWRNTPAHRRAQALGRDRFFTHYRLRMAEVTRDYDSRNRDEAPADSRRHHRRAALAGRGRSTHSTTRRGQ